MGRIFGTIQVNGRQCRTLFDSGAKNTYVAAAVAEALPRAHLAVPRPAALGGRVRHPVEICVLAGTLEGKPIEMDAYVLDEIGSDGEGRPIDILLGALAMRKWGIRLIPEEERLDLSRYPDEFTEFAGVMGKRKEQRPDTDTILASSRARPSTSPLRPACAALIATGFLWSSLETEPDRQGI